MIFDGKWGAEFAMEWFDPKNRAKRKARRKAFRKARRGKELTPEEGILMAEQISTVTLPSGETIQRTEPTIKARTSTKVAGATGLTFVAGLVTLVPFYDQINNVLLQACQSEQGPTVFLAGFALASGVAITTARLTKSPSKPGAI